MKKILLFVLLVLAMSLSYVSNAQCDFSGAGVRLNQSTYTDPETGKCMINIDLYFDLQSNSGGKFVYIHIWPTASYPDLNYNNPPEAAALVNSVATVGFYHFGDSLSMLDSYTPDNTIPNFLYTGLVIHKGPGSTSGYDRFSISNLVIASPLDCSVPQAFTADAWMSQSAGAQNVHCFSKGLQFYANDPKVTGLLFCQAPRTFRFDITTINTSGITVSYKVFLDDGDGVYNKTTDNIQVAAGSNISLDNTNNYKYSSAIMSYLPYSNEQPYADRSLWIVVTSPSVSNETYARLDNSCIPLPIQLKSFTAVRNKSVVELKWTTATELDNKGFYVERKYAADDWEIAGFVVSQANGGNSQEDLNYSFTENNIRTGITQYRIRQVDIDNKESYSVVRLVKGYGHTGNMIIYPNPSHNGQISVVFEKMNDPFTIELLDMGGRLVRKWVNYNEGRLTISNVSQGVYTLKVWSPATRELMTGKVIVSR